jgi:hypothetical protein
LIAGYAGLKLAPLQQKITIEGRCRRFTGAWFRGTGLPMIGVKSVRMKVLIASLTLFAFNDMVLAQHYAEPSDISRATIYSHNFKSKHHTKLAGEKQRALDAAHKAALRKIPDQPQPTDPWAKVRP